jgi:hypothetical protein
VTTSLYKVVSARLIPVLFIRSSVFIGWPTKISFEVLSWVALTWKTKENRRKVMPPVLILNWNMVNGQNFFVKGLDSEKTFLGPVLNETDENKNVL